MFDNLGTALVQAVGFFGVFGFFVYQLLSEIKKPIKTQLKPTKNKVNQYNDINEKPKKKGIFGRKPENIEDSEKPKKRRWFK